MKGAQRGPVSLDSASAGRICRLGSDPGWFFPISDAEQELDDNWRAIMYAALMVYCFLGVSITADAFMESIETVTSHRKKVKLSSGRVATVKVWNDTVATLSLMALGSSAPEIFLSFLELLKKEFHAGALGPSTIVGSAAFNLLVIIAVCIVVIPSGEVRKIENLSAFFITAGFSCLAYCWLVFILVISSEDVVELWEAAITFLFLPLLIWVSYKTDIGDSQWIIQRLTAVKLKGAPAQVPRAHIKFEVEALVVKASSTKQHVDVKVCLPDSWSGVASCQYRTEPFTSVPGYDYTETEGKLEFCDDAREGHISLEILPKRPHRTTCEFLLLLVEPEGDVAFDPKDDGGDKQAVLTVVLEAAGRGRGSSLRRIDSIVSIDGLRRGTRDWADQVLSSFCSSGSSAKDIVFHVVSFPWKFVAALTVPPTSYFGGWLCFFASLGAIGLLSSIISDLAEMFGCVVGVSDIVTAITFVALGTSMPDLFASLLAAKEDPTADASIVNVTGSNSVNIFLGLGLPWTVSSVYWNCVGRTEAWALRYPHIGERLAPGDAAFVVDSKNLGFSVLVYLSASLAAFLVLYLRRRLLGGELGGPRKPKVACAAAFILFWIGFIWIVSWRVQRWGKFDDAEMWKVIGLTGGFELVVLAYPICIMANYKLDERFALGSIPSQEALGPHVSWQPKPCENAGGGIPL